MRVVVLPLRRAGIALPFPDKRPRADWLEGHLQLARTTSRSGEKKVLELKLIGMHAPDLAPRLELLEPQWVACGGDEMRVRGLEVLDTKAVVMQEWLIDIRGTQRFARAGPPLGEIPPVR